MSFSKKSVAAIAALAVLGASLCASFAQAQEKSPAQPHVTSKSPCVVVDMIAGGAVSVMRTIDFETENVTYTTINTTAVGAVGTTPVPQSFQALTVAARTALQNRRPAGCPR